jgi:hypothetical protein
MTVPATPTAPTGVHLVQFTQPYRQARHYIGWTAVLKRRLVEHHAGRATRLRQVITQAGIKRTLAHAWQGTRKRERRVRRQGDASRRCPIGRADQERAR